MLGQAHLAVESEYERFELCKKVADVWEAHELLIQAAASNSVSTGQAGAGAGGAGVWCARECVVCLCGGASGGCPGQARAPGGQPRSHEVSREPQPPGRAKNRAACRVVRSEEPQAGQVNKQRWDRVQEELGNMRYRVTA